MNIPVPAIKRNEEMRTEWFVAMSPSLMLLVVGSIAVSLATLGAQSPSPLNYPSHRPLADALDRLERASGSPINYEDVPYENEADLVDVAPAHVRAANPGFRMMVPRKGTVNVPVPANRMASDGERVAHINDLLVSYRNNKLPGDFTVEQANGMLYVVPTKVLSGSGAERAVSSPMTARVTLPFGERRFIEGVSEILGQVNKATGARIDVGSLPVSPITRISFEANNEPARDLLTRLFGKLKVPASYRLLFDPSLKRYMLNINIPAGTNTTAPVSTTPQSATVSKEPGANPSFIKTP